MPGRIAGGVCAALALHFNWDIAVMRVAMVALSAMSGGIALWIYVGLWVMTPFERGGRAPGLRFFDWLGRIFAPPASTPQGQ